MEYSFTLVLSLLNTIFIRYCECIPNYYSYRRVMLPIKQDKIVSVLRYNFVTYDIYSTTVIILIYIFTFPVTILCCNLWLLFFEVSSLRIISRVSFSFAFHLCLQVLFVCKVNVMSKFSKTWNMKPHLFFSVLSTVLYRV